MTLNLTERQVTEQCIEWLRYKHWYCVRLQSGMMRGLTRGTYIKLGEKGLCDWCCFRNEQYFFLEMKATGKGLSEDQRAWFRFAEKNGILAAWSDGIGRLMCEYQRLFGGTA